MSTVFGEPANSSREPGEGDPRRTPPASPAGQANTAVPGAAGGPGAASGADEQAERTDSSGAGHGPGGEAPGYGPTGAGPGGYGPAYGQPGHGAPGNAPAGYGPGYGHAAYGAPAGPAGNAPAGYGPAGYGPGYGHAAYGAPAGPAGNAPAGNAPAGYGPGYGQAGYGQAGYGQAGYGAPGYGPGGGWYGPGAPGGGFGADSGDGRRRSRRRRFLVAGGSVAAAAALAFTGLGVANAMGPTVLSTTQIAAKVNPGLVDIYTNLGYQNGEAAGTGMVLTSTGEVLTNNHVINGATAIKAVDIGNGHTYTAKVVGYDKSDDVAVIKLQNASGLKTITLSSSAAKVGDKVVALGNAGGKGGTPSVATGKVTGLGQAITAADEGSTNAERLTGMTQTNVPIQAGDSGGPLLNTAGEVVGMNTAASSSSGTAGVQETGQSQTQAFAIPVAKATSIADQIEAGKASSTVHIGGTAFLGVQVSATGAGSDSGFGYNFGGGSSSNGAEVAGVVSGSAADQAGLTAGDVITSVAGHTVSSPSGISSVLQQYHPGQKITIGWTDQSGQSHTATVTLTTGPAA